MGYFRGNRYPKYPKPEGWVPDDEEPGRCQAWAPSVGRQCFNKAAPGERFCVEARHLQTEVGASKDPKYAKERVKKEDILPKKRTKAIRCRGKNKDGKTRCRNPTKNMNAYCDRHFDQDPDSPLRRGDDGPSTPAANSAPKPRNIAKHCNFDDMAKTAGSDDYPNVEKEGWGYVYIISEADPSDDLRAVKIGYFGSDPHDRLKWIQETSKRNLQLVYAVETNFKCLLEATVQACLDPLRKSDLSFGLDGYTELYEVSIDEAREVILRAAKAIAEERHLSLEDDVLLGFEDYYEMELDSLRDVEHEVDSVYSSAPGSEDESEHEKPTPPVVHSNEPDIQDSQAEHSVDVPATPATLSPAVQPDEPTLPATPSNNAPSVPIFKTNTGSTYHRDGCQWLKSRIPTTYEDAESSGLTPCRVCSPPASPA